ncbi:hypothetical protein EJ06DRAFT_525178 [Trichodelitschia bisporula]|uniref:SET domain-containing protein n=1 Tax=Trichodelitschia bisporula TaxID=703511 RepID=A0A6G1HIK0_9PEZI|nr:hypothetical protein EJ06DRAFT_525178 [Trichodelitschia bisporula]
MESQAASVQYPFREQLPVTTRHTAASKRGLSAVWTAVFSSSSVRLPQHVLGTAAYAPVALPPVTNGSFANGYSPTLGSAVEDDESTIKCFCGYSDDDGNTVYCEVCRTWQHIKCYYPGSQVPEVHECVQCRPRPYDARSAAERQRQSRIAAASGDRKGKRAPAKSQKKRAKEPVTTNGWAHPEQSNNADRAASSPRDQPPPTKRPKTNHRNTSSTSGVAHNIAAGSQRKRAGSNTVASTPVKASWAPKAGYTGEYYSQEFMLLHRRAFAHAKSNIFSSISVTDSFASWLNDVESLQEVTMGLTPREVFQRWDRPMEKLEETSPGATLHREEVMAITVHGQHPIQQWLTVNKDAGPNAYLGEMRGTIGHTRDYMDDPKNRWKELEHPEPFVFFYDKLPIYIDSREEGTQMRYVRRSCNPNAEIQVIILGTDYRFCLVSSREIEEGEELTIAWHNGKCMNILRDWKFNHVTLQPEDDAFLSNWVTTLLCNFGGCACGRQGQGACLFSGFDLRHRIPPPEPQQILKPTKSRRSKKGTQISPLSTGRATNSRAGSEAVIPGDVEDDYAESRSVSASSRSKPSSRDITPLAHTETGLGLGGVELSDREKRKLLQQERLFEKMELDEQHGNKKKRHSAGSALNTPSAQSSRQLGGADGQAPSPTPTVHSNKGHVTLPEHVKRAGISKPRAPAKLFLDVSTQTDTPPDVPGSYVFRDDGNRWSQKMRRLQKFRQRLAEEAAAAAVKASETPEQNVEEAPAVSTASAPPDASSSMPPPPLPAHVVDQAPNASATNEESEPVQSGVDGDGDVVLTDAPTVLSHPEPSPVPDAMDTSGSEPPAQPLRAEITASPEPVKPPTVAEDPPKSPFNLKLPSPSAPVEPQPLLRTKKDVSVPLVHDQPAAAPPPAKETTPPPAPKPQAEHSPPPPSTPFPVPATPASNIDRPPPPAVATPSAPPAIATQPSVPPLSISTTLPSPTFSTTQAPLVSPSLTSILTPVAAKKKLSLSDYTSRRKKQDAMVQAQAATNGSTASPTDEKKPEVAVTPAVVNDNSSEAKSEDRMKREPAEGRDVVMGSTS